MNTNKVAIEFFKNYREDVLEKILNSFKINPNEIKKLCDSTKVLAKYGWTLPRHLPIRKIRELSDVMSNGNVSQNELDNWFIEFFEHNNNNYLTEMFNSMKSNNELNIWNKAILESQDTYLDGRYVVIVPALISILEGVLAQKIGLFNTTQVKMIQPTKAHLDSLQSDDFDKPAWEAMSIFINSLYMKSDFTSKNPPQVLNRHWVVHGRMSPKESKIDALKLFNALDSIHLV